MLILMTFLLFSISPDTVHFTLEQAIDYALENNPEIQQLTFEYGTAKAQVGEALSVFYPNITANGGYAYLTDIPVFEIDGVPVPFGQSENYSLQVSLQQVLFAWGKLHAYYRIADIGERIAELNVVRKKQEIRYSVTDAFYGLLVLEETVLLSRESLAQLERHAQAVETRYKAGLVSQFDLLRAQVQVANLKPQIIGAENGLKLAREGFKMLLGLPLAKESAVSGELEMLEDTFDLDELTSTALEDRIELRNLQKTQDIANLGKTIARSEFLPTFVAGATYERKKPFSITGDEWGSNIVFNVGFEFPLFAGFRRTYRYKKATLALKEAELALENLEKAIRFEVKQAYLNFAAANEAIATAQENVGQSEKAFEIIETRYRNGLATNLEFMDAQLAMMQAKTNYFSALKNYYTSRAEIFKAIGKEE